MHRETEMNSSQLTNDNMKSPIFTYLINFAKMEWKSNGILLK